MLLCLQHHHHPMQIVNQQRNCMNCEVQTSIISSAAVRAARAAPGLRFKAVEGALCSVGPVQSVRVQVIAWPNSTGILSASKFGKQFPVYFRNQT